MLGLVLTLMTTATPALPPADATCVEGPACEALVAPADEDRTYATPVIVACPSPVPRALSTLVGECISAPPVDGSFLVSRTPDADQRPLAFRAARRDRRGRAASCDGLPPRGPELALSDAQPLALYAAPVVVREVTRAPEPVQVFMIPSRFRDPPDRPPRV
jgi:hypothetical protein